MIAKHSAISVGFPAAAGAVNLFPGAVRTQTTSSTPLDLFVGTGCLHTIAFTAGAALVDVAVYNYSDAAGRMIKGGTTPAAATINGGSIDAASGLTTVICGGDLMPDRSWFDVVVSGATPADLNGTHRAFRVNATTFVVDFLASVGPTLGTVTYASGSHANFGRATGVATAGVLPGVNREGASEALFEVVTTGALPTGLVASRSAWAERVPLNEHVLLEPNVQCPLGMVIRLSAATAGQISVTYTPELLGGGRKALYDRSVEGSLPVA